MYADDLSPAAAFALLTEQPQAVLVDVRTRAEWTYVGIPDLTGLNKDAVLVEWQSFPEGAVNSGFIGELTAAGVRRDVPVMFLCRSGVRSVAAARAAAAAGFSQAFNVRDGFEGPPDPAGHRGAARGWKAAGLPWKQS